MIYITGDTHGYFGRVTALCREKKTTRDDILIILGDVALNYYGGERDREKKAYLASLPLTVFCIHGNHEMRPQHVEGYIEKTWRGGTVLVQEAYPNLLFAKDGEIFDFDGVKAIVIGGAYSVDRNMRILFGTGWWPDEQPDEETKARAEAQLERCGWKIDAVLSHTAPLAYEPVEMFLPSVNQRQVDKTTEIWLDAIERRLDYRRWYCGHYHTAKRVHGVEFMFQNVGVFMEETK